MRTILTHRHTDTETDKPIANLADLPKNMSKFAKIYLWLYPTLFYFLQNICFVVRWRNQTCFRWTNIIELGLNIYHRGRSWWWRGSHRGVKSQLYPKFKHHNCRAVWHLLWGFPQTRSLSHVATTSGSNHAVASAVFSTATAAAAKFSQLPPVRLKVSASSTRP